MLRQRRDNEESVEYAVRKEFSEAGLEMLKRILTDVDEVLIYTDEPIGDEGFRSHLDIVIRDGAPLAKLIGELRSVPSWGFRIDHSKVCSGGLSVGIPKFIQPGLLALLANSQLSGTAAEKGALRIVQGGKLEIEFSLASSAEGEPALTIEVVTEIQEDELASLANLAGTKVDAEGRFQIPLPPDFFGENLSDYLITGEFNTDRLRIFADRQSLKSSESVQFSRDTAKLEQADSRNTDALVKLDIDLHDLATLDPECGSKQLLVRFERMYQWYLGTQNPIFLRQRGAAPLDEFVSLVPQIRSDGDSTLHLELRTYGSGERIIADCRIGRELYGLLQARRLVSQKAVFRSR